MNYEMKTKATWLMTYRIVSLWTALGLNLLVALTIYLEGMGKMDIFYFKDDCAAADHAIVAWASTLVPLLIAWALPNTPLKVKHWVVFWLYFFILILEFFVWMIWAAFCDFHFTL